VERGRVVVRWIKMEDGRWKSMRVRVYRGWREGGGERGECEG
jgi:hypothetical protein